MQTEGMGRIFLWCGVGCYRYPSQLGPKCGRASRSGRPGWRPWHRSSKSAVSSSSSNPPFPSNPNTFLLLLIGICFCAPASTGRCAGDGLGDSKGKWIKPCVIGVSQLLWEELGGIAKGTPSALLSRAGMLLLKREAPENVV